MGKSKSSKPSVPKEDSDKELAKEWYKKATDFRKAKDLDNALPAYQKALMHEPNNPSILNDMAWTYYLLGKYEETIKYAEIAADLAPQKWFIWDTLACGYFGLRDMEKAWGAFQRMKKLNPNAKGTEVVYQTVKKALKGRAQYSQRQAKKKAPAKESDLWNQIEPYSKLIWTIMAIAIVILVIHDIVMGAIVFSSFLGNLL